MFHYEEPTDTTFGDQPKLQDPLDKKYVYLKRSVSFDSAEEGTYAVRDIPANTKYVLYGGYIYDKEQNINYNENLLAKVKVNQWMKDDPDFLAQWMYR